MSRERPETVGYCCTLLADAYACGGDYDDKMKADARFYKDLLGCTGPYVAMLCYIAARTIGTFFFNWSREKQRERRKKGKRKPGVVSTLAKARSEIKNAKAFYAEHGPDPTVDSMLEEEPPE